MEARALGRKLDEDRDRTVRLRPGLGEEAVGNLPLHHHAPEPDVRQPVEALDDQGGRNVVGQVGDELCRVRRELDAERVPEDDVDIVGEAAERRLEGAIDLDRMDAADAFGEVASEDALPRPDLEHDVVRPELGEAADHLEDVRVAQEVLAVLLPGPGAHASAKHSEVFRSI